MRNRARLALLLLVLVTGFSSADSRAQDPAPEDSPYGKTYTEAELAALDRALHAANMTREDLTFDKAVTKGHGCLPLVSKMLADPLLIPVVMDLMVSESGILGSLRGPDDALYRALYLVEPELRFSTFQPPPEPHPTSPSAKGLLDHLARLVDPRGSPQIFTELPAGDLDLLRHSLPEEMAWHDVFASPFDEKRAKSLEKQREALGDAWLHETAAKIELGKLRDTWESRFGGLQSWLRALPAEAFPTDAPIVRETPFGRVAIGTPGDDVYTGEFAALIDPGGNDRYLGCRIGAAYGTKNRRIGLFADLSGNDVYECGDVNFTLGAAILGIAAFYGLGAGNDRYVGGHASMGAAMGGIPILDDDGGSDVYEGKTFTQGAAGFGIGILNDDSVQAEPETSTDEGTKEPVEIALFDNDRLSAWANAQAFARARGIALCLNLRGNDTYEAGGVYLHAPLFSDRYQSFSQGFAIGERGIDWAGGIALIADLDGNDRYLGDIYNQGVGYWYAAGLLYDGGGNDVYEMTQYGQGSGIHLAVGGLTDVSGNDAYIMHSGLGQGGSHDYAASVFMDRGGDDRYLGMSSCNGCGLTNSVGLHFERSGNDVYAARRSGGMNSGRPARGFSSIGVLVDLAGKDDYLGLMKDGGAWRIRDIGVGLDRSGVAGGGPPEAADQTTGKAEIPPICRYEGDLTQEVFDELWEISVRWEVGDNRVIVPEARKRLAAFGKAILPMMDAKMDKDESGLELRAYTDLLKKLREAGAAEEVTAFLGKNLRSDMERRRKVALHLTGELKNAGLEEDLLAILTGEDESLARRAAGVFRAIGSHGGDQALLTWLATPADERRVAAALGTLLGLEADCYPQVRGFLDHPLLSVRTLLASLLAQHSGKYAPAMRADVWSDDVSPRARRTLLDVLVRSDLHPETADVAGAVELLVDKDWGMRADAARVIRRWEGLPDADPQVLSPALTALTRLLESEKDPYVRFCADGVR